MKRGRKSATVNPGPDPARVARVQELRRSNAAGLHGKKPARGAVKRAAIISSRGD